MCTDCDRDFLCFKSIAGGLPAHHEAHGSKLFHGPVGHMSSRVHVPGRKIYVPRALGHTLMSSPGLFHKSESADLKSK